MVVAAILAVVAGWRFTPPPRALAAAVTPLAIHIHTEKAMFQVLVSPGKGRRRQLRAAVDERRRQPAGGKEATLTLSLPERGIEPLERKATLGRRRLLARPQRADSLPGRWHLRIDALVTDFQKITLEDDFEVPAR